VHLPLEYAAVISVLLAWRLYDRYAKPARRPVPNKSVAQKESASPAAE
jgi:hypothetical protein